MRHLVPPSRSGSMADNLEAEAAKAFAAHPRRGARSPMNEARTPARRHPRGVRFGPDR
jgi:hypothetical protein